MDFSEHCTVTARLRHFSSCEGEDSGCTEYDCDGKRFSSFFKPTFYANGGYVIGGWKENKGHVSIVFEFHELFFSVGGRSVTFSCVASVIDASGNKRFPQSLVVHHDVQSKRFGTTTRASFWKDFSFEKYLKRSTLLSDSSELLPDDCLTLHLEIDYEIIQRLIVKNAEKYNYGLYYEGDGWHIRIDSEFGRDLCSMSDVFERLRETPMVEKATQRVSIRREEWKSFLLIYDFLTRSSLECSISDICDLYIVADKYNMQQITELCRQLLKSVMREINNWIILHSVGEDVHLISDLAEAFEGDESLRDVLATYSDINDRFDPVKYELDVSGFHFQLESEWKCTFVRGRRYFTFHKIKSEDSQMDLFK